MLIRLNPYRIIPGIAFTYIMHLITSYSNISYYRDFIQAGPWIHQSNNIEMFDFIVGGGSAGAAVANRLSKHNKVLLLELGGDPHPLTYIPALAVSLQGIPSIDLMYKSVPQKYGALSLKDNTMPWPKGVGLGGTSNLNSMIYQRGNPNDYDNWANITGNSDWSYENVLPFFKKLEDYNGAYANEKFHSKGGPIHVEKVRQTYMTEYFLNAAKEKGYHIKDLNSRQTEGFSDLDVTMKNGLRWNTFVGYIKPILLRKNLTIYRYSRVIKVHLDRKRHAYGVTYYRYGVRRFVRARKEIILSAGAVDSTKLLLLSGVGPIEHLHSVQLKCRINLPVGKNLQDHVFSLIGPIFVNTTESVIIEREARNIKNVLYDFTVKRRGLIVSNGASGLGFVSTSVRNNPSWPEIQLLLNAIGPSQAQANLLENLSNVRKDVLKKYLSPYFGMDANFIGQVLVRPKSIGEIKLVNRDPFTNPIIQPNCLQHEDDVKALVEGTKKIIDLYENTTIYKKINARLTQMLLPGCELEEFKSDAYYECFIRHFTFTLYHSVGTVAMGKNLNDSRAVLDSELRLLKATGLRVIDGSIMPVIVNSNTNIPIIMIGEVGSFFIRRYWAMQYEVCLSFGIHLFYSHSEDKCYYSRFV